MRVFLKDSSSTRRRKAHLRSWLATLTAAVLLAALPSGTATAATPRTIAPDKATVINDWNALAVTTLLGDTTKPPTEHLLYMASVQAAVYDAVVGVEGRYAPTGSTPTRPMAPPPRRQRWPPPIRSW